ncbi:MAG: hypothetical protein K6F57_02250 [Candidatus Saccharibacteria bacterium]|nr:hypothetical protein [Candidatus Saccharibacteria bacterium]
MALTFKNANHVVAIYPNGNAKWIAIPAGGADFDDVITKERNDGMLMLAINDADQRIAIVAPDATVTDKAHDRLIQEVRDWLDRLATVPYKGNGEKATSTMLNFGGLIVQPADKTVMSDGPKSKAQADGIVQHISDWIKATTFKNPDPDGGKGGDGGKKPGPDGGKGGTGPDGKKPTSNFELGAKLFRDALAGLSGGSKPSPHN